MTPRLMIYGAYGYTGDLIARAAVEDGLQPVLAARNADRIKAFGEELECEYRAFDLSDVDEIAKHLADIDVVLHCAGPYSATAEAMLQACLKSRTHYCDVSGEFEVFERAHELSEAAQDSGIVLCPGVGFDVIPTDCLANVALQALPDATELAVAVDALPILSPGSMKTMIESFTRDGSIARVDGEWIHGAVAPKFREFTFDGVSKFSLSMPLADLLAIGYSTQVDTIDVFHATPMERLALMQRLTAHADLLKQEPVRELVMAVIEAAVEGPGESRREQLPANILAEVRNTEGEAVVARVSTPNGYTITRDGALACARLLLDFDGDGGYYTPFQLGGRQLLENLPGVSAITLSDG